MVPMSALLLPRQAVDRGELPHVPGGGREGAEAIAGLRHAVAEGMKIFTQSQKATGAQRATMEFLLINHPSTARSVIRR